MDTPRPVLSPEQHAELMRQLRERPEDAPAAWTPATPYQVGDRVEWHTHFKRRRRVSGIVRHMIAGKVGLIVGVQLPHNEVLYAQAAQWVPARRRRRWWRW